MKYVIVIPDGAGDRPQESLDFKTPLEAAHTPTLDFLSAKAQVGLSENIPPGFTPGTDIGCMSIFGYDPSKFYSGRGPLEAAQLGVSLKGKELAFRCNLVTEQEGILKDYSADHISLSEARQIFQTLNKEFSDLPVKFYPGLGTGYRNLMVLMNPEKGTDLLKIAPPHDIMGERVEEHLPSESDEPLLRKLMMDSKAILEDHPVNKARERGGRGKANMIWLWGQGKASKWPSYQERFNKRCAVITAVDLVKGIGIYAGLDVINVPGVTGYFDTNYEGKAEYAVNSLKIRDAVIIHIEATDEAGHMGEVKLKVEAIENIDRRLLKPLVDALEVFGEYKIMVVPDHFTCLSTRTHSMDPVPYLIYSNRHPLKGPSKFCERTAAETFQPMRKGHELVELLFSS